MKYWHYLLVKGLSWFVLWSLLACVIGSSVAAPQDTFLTVYWLGSKVVLYVASVIGLLLVGIIGFCFLLFCAVALQPPHKN
jgi:hypothetical protein